MGFMQRRIHLSHQLYSPISLNANKLRNDFSIKFALQCLSKIKVDDNSLIRYIYTQQVEKNITTHIINYIFIFSKNFAENI